MRFYLAATHSIVRITSQLTYVVAFALAGFFLFTVSSSAKDFRIYRHHLIEGMPYIQQSHPNTCGAAALAMLLSFHEGRKVTEDDILTLHPEIREKGFWIPYLWEICQERGLDTAQGEGAVEGLKKLILKGHPVIVYQYSWFPKETKPTSVLNSNDTTAKPKHTEPGRPHFRVVIGFDEKRRVFITHDPAPELGKNYEIPFQQFEALWSIPWCSSESTTKHRLFFTISDKPQA